jgi:Fe2+ transport system protein FeoA
MRSAAVQPLTFSGSSLSVMRAQEEGVIQSISTADPITSQTLQRMGIGAGLPIKVVRTRPYVVVQSGESHFMLDPLQASAIYVRLSNPICSYPHRSPHRSQSGRRMPYVRFSWLNPWRHPLDPSVCSGH